MILYRCEINNGQNLLHYIYTKLLSDWHLPMYDFK